MLIRTGLTRTGGSAVTLAVTLVLALSGCSDDADPAPTAAPQTSGVVVSATTTAVPAPTSSKPVASATGKATPGPAQTKPVGKPAVAISLAPAVKVGKPSEISGDVVVTVGKVRDVTVKAEQPGEIAGPAVAVPVTVRNASGKAFSLGGMVVTAFYGDDDIPGNETTSGPSKPMTGSLAAGKTAKGTYVFNVPRKYASTLRIEVASNESPTIVQFNR